MIAGMTVQDVEPDVGVCQVFPVGRHGGVLGGDFLADGQGVLIRFLRLRVAAGGAVQGAQVVVAYGQVVLILGDGGVLDSFV
jgi:hypothetical protein